MSTALETIQPLEVSEQNLTALYANLNTAMAKAQSEFRLVPKTKTATIKSDKGTFVYKYADLADILEMALPVISRHGLSLRQPIRRLGNQFAVFTELHHASGESVSDDGLPLVSGGSPQAFGSSLTYMRRYGACCMLGIAPDADEDGALATAEKRDREAQQQTEVHDEVARQKAATKSKPAEDRVEDPISPALEFSYNETTGVLICVIVDVQVKTKKTADKAEFIAVKINQAIDGKDVLFYFHNTHKAALLAAKGKTLKCIITASGDFKQISDVMEIDGQRIEKADDSEALARQLASELGLEEEELRELHGRFAQGNWSETLRMLQERKSAMDNPQDVDDSSEPMGGWQGAK